MPESRTYPVPPDIVTTLRTPPSEMSLEELGELIEWMPEAMTPREIDDVGLKVSNDAELERPSRNGVTRGRREEDRSLITLGNLALQREDLVTAENIRKHLGKWPWSTEGLFGSLLLKRKLNRVARQIVEHLRDA